MRPARCIAPSECWNRLCSAAGNTQRADWSWGTRRNRCTHEVSMRSCSVASPRIAPGRVSGGPEGRDLADEEPAVGFHRVEPEPGARRPAHDPARADQLVLSGHELLDGDGEVRVRRLTEPERDDTDDLAPFVDHRAPAPARARRRDHEGAVEHVLPVRREALDRLELADDVHEVTVVV